MSVPRPLKAFSAPGVLISDIVFLSLLAERSFFLQQNVNKGLIFRTPRPTQSLSGYDGAIIQNIDPGLFFCRCVVNPQNDKQIGFFDMSKDVSRSSLTKMSIFFDANVCQGSNFQSQSPWYSFGEYLRSYGQKSLSGGKI